MLMDKALSHGSTDGYEFLQNWNKSHQTFAYVGLVGSLYNKWDPNIDNRKGLSDHKRFVDGYGT